MLLGKYRMLDLSRLFPGPLASHLLADMGMDVVKIEEPRPRYGMGRDMMTPPDPTPEEEVASSAYNSIARNKRSVALELLDEAARPKAREVFFRLVERADVVLEGYRPGVVGWLGVDYEAVRARNPRIVYCSISAFGQSGPYAGFPGHDRQMSAVAGSVGPRRPETGEPLGHGVAFADVTAGLHAAAGILAALLEREETGKGQYLDVSMVGSVMSSNHGAYAQRRRDAALRRKAKPTLAVHPHLPQVPRRQVADDLERRGPVLGELLPPARTGALHPAPPRVGARGRRDGRGHPGHLPHPRPRRLAP